MAKISFDLTPVSEAPVQTLEEIIKAHGGVQFLELRTIDEDLPEYHGEPRVMIGFRIDGKIVGLILDKDGIVVNRGVVRGNEVGHVLYRYLKDIETVIFQN